MYEKCPQAKEKTGIYSLTFDNKVIQRSLSVSQIWSCLSVKK